MDSIPEAPGTSCNGGAMLIRRITKGSNHGLSICTGAACRLLRRTAFTDPPQPQQLDSEQGACERSDSGTPGCGRRQCAAGVEDERPNHLYEARGEPSILWCVRRPHVDADLRAMRSQVGSRFSRHSSDFLTQFADNVSRIRPRSHDSWGRRR